MQLSDQLGVSRIPICETLERLAARGALVGEQNGKGVRIRQYMAEEVHRLYEYRELLEGGAVRATTDIDIARLVWNVRLTVCVRSGF